MITNRAELKEYLAADKKNLGYTKRWPRIFADYVWKFQISLRYYEYFKNTPHRHIGMIRELMAKYFYRHYSVKLGFTIPPNTCGKGLNIHHYGCIVISGYARIGENCCIQQCVNIGQNYLPENVPTIGNNVYIGPGAKLFGKIEIADGCAIGAGSVVTRSFLEKNHVIVGNPARDIGERKPGLR